MAAIFQLNYKVPIQAKSGVTGMSDEVTGIAFKALYDAVFSLAGEKKAEFFTGIRTQQSGCWC